MQTFSQKYTIIALLEDVNESAEFSSNDWPLHITIADTFAVERVGNDFNEKLTNLIADKTPITAVADHDEFFGPGQEVQVAILDTNESLVGLHYDVIDLLESYGGVLNAPQYSKGGFRAHATVQSHARLVLGEAVTITQLALVDMFPNENPYQRKILKVVNLHD